MTDPEFAPYSHVATAIFGIDIGDDGVPRYSYLNPAAANATGLNLSDIKGLTASDVHPGRGGELAYHRQIKAAALADETYYVIDVGTGGRSRFMRTTLMPVTDDTGRVTRLIGTALEVGSHLSAPDLASSWGAGLTEVEQFVAMAAHDLRTPMRNVQIIAEMLREGFEDRGDGKLDLIDLLDDVASKSSELISEVLEHAQSGSVTPERLPFDFGLLCRTTREVLDPTGKHQITWSGAAMQADKTAIQIALRNLLDNALKHGQRDVVRVHISACAPSEGLIEIAVSDNGVGFENPGQVFLDTGEFRTGSGYGLLGIRRLINARGGTIKVDRGRNGAGSTVRFTLPGSLALIELPYKAKA